MLAQGSDKVTNRKISKHGIMIISKRITTLYHLETYFWKEIGNFRNNSQKLKALIDYIL